MGLFDGLLIKDNHIQIAGGIEEAVRRARATGSRLPIEVEAQSLEDVDAALRAKVDVIMLDNLDDDEMQPGDPSDRARRARRDLWRRHARSAARALRRSAPTTSPSARSRTRRRLRISPSRSNEALVCYIVSACPTRFPPISIHALVSAEPRLAGFAHLRYFAEVESTNDLALKLCMAGAPEGTSVLADVQHAGRGRRGHTWFSPPARGSISRSS